mmetsp:Transcript_5388/g.14181  ORF Transcript_5388/g.14181 Transcript_5388/m.14181 type:complete len:204 (-) Transcript_5388:988-1599(-)
MALRGGRQSPPAPLQTLDSHDLHASPHRHGTRPFDPGRTVANSDICCALSAAAPAPTVSHALAFASRLCRAQLVVSILGDVAHPRERLVAALLDDLQVAHLDARDGEVGDLKLDRDRRLVFLVLIIRHRGQAKVRTHQVLLAAMELLDRPYDRVALGGVLDGADRRLERRSVRVGRHGDDDLNVVGSRALLELRLRLDHVLDA